MRILRPAAVHRGVSESELFQQAALNQRRITLKRVLLNYMGLSLTREQPDLYVEDVEFTGLGEELKKVADSLQVNLKEVRSPADSIEIEVNGVAIVLDDEMRFNEFRYQTLQSPIYCLPLIYNLNRYKSYCLEKRQKASLSDKSRGRKDRAFLQKKSSPTDKWEKLQAISDFMQDLLPLVHYVPVLRLSVYDQLETPQGLRTLSSLLMEEKSENYELLADYLIHQLEELEEVFNMEY